MPRDGLHPGHPSVPEGAASVPSGGGEGGAAQAMRGMRLDRGVAGSLGAPVPRPAWQEGDLEEAQIEILRRPDGTLHEIGSGAYGKARGALQPCRHNTCQVTPARWQPPASRKKGGVRACRAGRRWYRCTPDGVRYSRACWPICSPAGRGIEERVQASQAFEGLLDGVQTVASRSNGRVFRGYRVQACRVRRRSTRACWMACRRWQSSA